MGNSGLSEFIDQILPLLIMTGLAGILWVMLTVFIIQRAAERRRREREGLPPLPNGFKQIMDFFRGESQAAAINRHDESFTVPSSDTLSELFATDIPLPSTGELVEPIPAPDLNALTDDIPPLDDEPSPFETMAQPEIDNSTTQIGESTTVIAAPIEKAVPPAQMQIQFESIPDDAVEMLRVWRDLDSGQLIFQMKGQVFNDLAQLRAANLDHRFKNLVDELTQVLGEGASRNDPARPSPYAPPPAPIAASQPQPSATQNTKTTEDATSEPFGIAEQIEAFLQMKLKMTPDYAGRSIHVHPAMGGGVEIEVDGEVYEAVSDVADADVRAFLQETIQQWESDR